MCDLENVTILQMTKTQMPLRSYYVSGSEVSGGVLKLTQPGAWAVTGQINYNGTSTATGGVYVELAGVKGSNYGMQPITSDTATLRGVVATQGFVKVYSTPVEITLNGWAPNSGGTVTVNAASVIATYCGP